MIRSLLTSAVTLGLLAWAIPAVQISNWVTLIGASIGLSFLYGVIRPVLKLLFLPINFVTLGLFSVLINVFLLWLLTVIIPQFDIVPIMLLGVHLSKFWTLVFISFVISMIQSIVKLVI